MRRHIACTFLCLALACSATPALAESTDTEQFKLDLIMAKRGDFDAQFSVGAAYEYGRGVKRDLKQAFYWYKKAASNGHHRAQYKVGEFYERGLGGVKKDIRNAKIWYRLATMGNVREARARLRQLENAGTTRSTPPRPAAAKPRPKVKPTPKPQPRPQPKPVTKPKPARTAKAPVRKPAPPRRPPAPRYDPAEIPALIRAGEWQGRDAPNLILPTGARCLKSGKTKIICFSPEQRLTVGGRELTFTTKATLSDFQPDGHFKVRYIFNVTRMEPTNRPADATPSFGLRPELGWQEPAREMRCQLERRDRIVCYPEGRRLVFTRK